MRSSKVLRASGPSTLPFADRSIKRIATMAARSSRCSGWCVVVIRCFRRVVGRSGGGGSLAGGIVGVALGTEAIECRRVRFAEGRVDAEALDEIRIGDVGRAERNEVGVATGENGVGFCLVEAGVDDDRHRRHWPEGPGHMADLHTAFGVPRIRLEKTEIADPKGVERANDKAERLELVAVVHTVKIAGRRQPNA